MQVPWLLLLCDPTERTDKTQIGEEVREKPQHHLVHVRGMLVLLQGLRDRNQLGGSDSWCVGPDGSAFFHVSYNIDIAVRTATGEEMSNSTFRTGFVVNRQ